MRRHSFTGPMVLIVIGLLFLLNNLNPGFSIGGFIAQYWPFLLIVMGVIGLVEVLANAASGTDPGRRVFHFAWVLWPLLFFGLVFSGPNQHIRFPSFNSGGVGIFGTEYEYDVNASAPATGVSRIVLDNTRGSLNIKGDSEGEVRITGHRTIRAYNKSDADRVNEQSPVKIEKQGDLLLVHADNTSGNSISSSADIDITIPRGLNVEAHGRSGDVSIDDVDGSVDIENGHGDVRLGNIGKDVKIEASRSGLIRAVGVKGTFDMDGNGGDVQLENVAGMATINGEYSGTLEFRNFASAMHFHSSRTDFRAASIPGMIRMDLGDLKLESVVGPVHFETTSRDIVATDVTDELDLSVAHGDIQVTESKAPLPKMNIHSKNGNLTLSIPDKAAFDLEGTTQRGEIENEFGTPLDTITNKRESTVKGVVSGTGEVPQILLTTARGTITIEKN